MNKSRLAFLFPESRPLSGYIFIPLFPAFLLVYLLFRDSNFVLESFAGRPLSLASMEGVDIAARVTMFYKAIAAFLLFSSAFLFLFKKLQSLLDDHDIQIVNGLSAAGFLLLPFQLIGANMGTSFHLLFTLLFAAVAGVLVKNIFKQQQVPTNYTVYFFWIISLSLSLYFISFYLLPDFRLITVFEFTGLFSALFIFFTARKTKFSDSELLSRKIRQTVPLACIPLAGILATEIAFIANQRGIYSPQPTTLFLFFLLVIIGSVIFRKRFAKIDNTSPEQVFNHSWLPLIVAGIITLALYKSTIVPEIDWFEDANRILPLQQWFEFGKIPFLDSFSSHAFSDFASGLLFSVLNGYNPLGGFLYAFLISVFTGLIVYFLLLRLSGHAGFAFFFAIFYPYTEYFLPSYFNFIPITLLLLLRLREQASVKNYILYFSVLVGMIFWRIDLGSANLAAGLLALLCWRLLDREHAGGTKNMFKALLAVTGSVLLLFLMALLFRGQELFSRLQEALAYLSSMQSYGLKDLSPAQDLRYYSLYFLVPAAVLLISGASVYKYLKGRLNINWILAILFFTFFYLINLQRGLVRHTLAEGWDTALTSYSFFLILSSIIVFSRSGKFSIKHFFLFGLGAYLLISNYKFNPPDKKQNNVFHAAIIKLPEQTLPTLGTERIERIAEPDNYRREKYGQLKTFIDEHLRADETYFDFSNTPMLYYFLNRRNPDYLCQPPHTAHNDYMQSILLDKLKKENLPVVVFSSYPETFWDRLDGLSNRMRHYRISEYIFTHYRPFTILNNKTVWLRKDIQSSPNSANLFSYRKDEENANPVQRINSFFFQIKTQKENNFAADLRILAATQGTLTCRLSYRKKDGTTANLQQDVTIPSGWSSPYLPLNLPPDAEELTSLEMETNGVQAKVHSVNVYEGKEIPEKLSDFSREDDLRLIPYIWGNYDDKFSPGKSQVIATISSEEKLLPNENEIRYSLNTTQAEPEGNYILLKACAISQDVDIILNYGKDNEKNGGFVFRVLKNEKAQHYLIRISTQYNWYNREHNWISLYPMGGDMKISSVQLLKGD